MSKNITLKYNPDEEAVEVELAPFLYKELEEEYYETIREIVDDISEVLDIPMGEIEYLEPADMPTSTTNAAITGLSHKIMLNRDLYNPDRGIGICHIYFLAHAIRMSWQQRTGRLNMIKIKSQGKCSIEEYNFQDFMIDAHAFAYLYLGEFYGEEEYDKIDNFMTAFMLGIPFGRALLETVLDRAAYILETEPDLFIE